MKEPVVVGRLLRQTVEFALRGTALECRFVIPDDLWPAELDEGQVGQVLSNLAINAVQSMPGGGAVRVIAENLEVDDRSELLLKPGPYVRISVCDQGTGILPEHQTIIFDPYFTTKQRGSGLGLAVAQSVVTRHGGIITLQSEPGKGARFLVHLPAAPNLKLTSSPQKGPAAALMKGRALVMDDEAGVLKVTGLMLGKLGYQPEPAHTGEEALEQGPPFQVVICDLVIPGGMGGTELVKILKKMSPQTPVIAASGYANDPVLADTESFGFDSGLAKPFSLDELKTTIAHLTRR